jgi:hypothetical protein
MSDAPINVRFEIPTHPPKDWETLAQKWRRLNDTPMTIGGEQRVGHPGFYPLTIKAAYITGVIYELCSTVSYLLQRPDHWQQFYLPAYGVFASGVDLLGRCLQGNETDRAGLKAPKGNAKPELDIIAGFQWLKNPSYPAYEQIAECTRLVITTERAYTIDMLVQLRHFAAHGQGATRDEQFGNIDRGILGEMPSLLTKGLEKYWHSLMGPKDVAEDLCNRLARAKVDGFRDGPVHTMWDLLQGMEQHGTVASIFGEFDWKPPQILRNDGVPR